MNNLKRVDCFNMLRSITDLFFLNEILADELIRFHLMIQNKLSNTPLITPDIDMESG